MPSSHRSGAARRAAGRTAKARVAEVGEELVELLDEVVRERRPAVALQRVDGLEVGSGRPADAEVDPLAVEGGEDAELLGHLERAVVREHHAAAADPDAARPRGDLGDEDLRRGGGEHRGRVVLGDPVARVAELLGELGEVERVAKRVGAGGALGDRRLVEDGESDRPGRHRGIVTGCSVDPSDGRPSSRDGLDDPDRLLERLVLGRRADLCDRARRGRGDDEPDDRRRGAREGDGALAGVARARGSPGGRPRPRTSSHGR